MGSWVFSFLKLPRFVAPLKNYSSCEQQALNKRDVRFGVQGLSYSFKVFLIC